MSNSTKYLKRASSKSKLSKALKSMKTSAENIAIVNDYEIQNLRKALQESQNTGDSLMQRLSEAMEANKQTVSELRIQQYNNMNIQQQLEDERNIYLIEKRQLFDEISSLKNQLGYGPGEDNKYRQLMVEHNQEIAELCVKFLKNRNITQKLRDDFISFQKESAKEINKLNCRIRELAEALTMLRYAGQYSKAYVKATRRYLQLQHDNQCLSRQINFLKSQSYGFSAQECISIQLLRNAMTMTDFKNDYPKNVNNAKEKTQKKTQRRKEPQLIDLDVNLSSTTISTTSQQTVNNDLISFDDVELESRPHGDGADHNDIAQIEVTESTSTSYFTLKHIMEDFGVDISSTKNSHINAMRSQSNPEIIKPKTLVEFDAKYMCYRKDFATNT